MNTKTCRLVPLLLIALAGCGGSQPAQTLGPGGLNTETILQGLQARTHRTVAQVGGLEDARRARAELQRISEDYDDLLFQAEKLTPDGRTVLSRAAARAQPGLASLVQQVHDMPALDDIMGVTLDGILGKLDLVRQIK